MLASRYILSHITRAFFAALAVLFGVLLIVQWIKIGGFISLSDIDILFLALVPMSAFVIPMALLFSVLLVLGRLSSESEIIAMKACGLKDTALYRPVLIFSVICALCNLAVSVWIGPLSMKLIQASLVEKAPQKVYSFIKEREFDDTFNDLVVYVESVDQSSKELYGIFIETLSEPASVVTASRGTIDVGPSGIMLRLEDGSIYMSSEEIRRHISFDEYTFALEADFGHELSIGNVEMATMKELKGYIKAWPRPKWIKAYHDRLTFPLLNIILGLIGIAFGIQRPRSPKYTGFILGISTILGYYLVYMFSDRMVRAEIMQPVLGSWLPNIVFILTLVFIRFWRKKKA